MKRRRAATVPGSASSFDDGRLTPLGAAAGLGE